MINFILLSFGLKADNLPAPDSLLGDRVIPSQGTSNKVPGDTVIPTLGKIIPIKTKQEAQKVNSPFVLIERPKKEEKASSIPVNHKESIRLPENVTLKQSQSKIIKPSKKSKIKVE